MMKKISKLALIVCLGAQSASAYTTAELASVRDVLANVPAAYEVLRLVSLNKLAGNPALDQLAAASAASKPFYNILASATETPSPAGYVSSVAGAVNTHIERQCGANWTEDKTKLAKNAALGLVSGCLRQAEYAAFGKLLGKYLGADDKELIRRLVGVAGIAAIDAIQGVIEERIRVALELNGGADSKKEVGEMAKAMATEFAKGVVFHSVFEVAGYMLKRSADDTVTPDVITQLQTALVGSN